MKTIKILNTDILNLLDAETSSFPKYATPEIIEAPILFYEKVKDGIKITFDEKLME
jgi:hypothetical protein